MRRREFITLLGGAAAGWPLAARAQQPAMPLIGFLSHGYPRGFAPMVAGFHEGLRETGYVQGQNVAIEYRWAENQFDQLPALAADLARRQVAAIFTNGPPSTRAAKGETATIPIVFSMGEDPIKEGIVASLNRPGGNVTGFSYFTNQLFGKRMALLTEIVPGAAAFAFLVNPTNPNADPDARDAQLAAAALGRKLEVLTASTEADFEKAFATIVQRQIGALCVGTDAFFMDRREQLVALAVRHALPAIYDRREFAAAGGLVSYGASQVDSWRQGGNYIGRILKGETPNNLPVQQSTKIDFVINLKTAKALGLDIAPMVVARADEVIE
jgi:putative tryptophan/tyrosine transport system substrate-binding protein